VAIFLTLENLEVEDTQAVIETGERKRGRTMGPVDYLLVRFTGNKFSGEIIPELMRLERDGIVRVIDMVLVMKDSNGKIFVTEAKDLKADTGKAFKSIAKNTREWFYEGDINAISENLPNNSSAGLLLFENIWAIRFKEALMNSDAELIDMGRILPDVVEKARELLDREGGA